MYTREDLNSIPSVVKNILIINITLFACTWLLRAGNIVNLNEYLAFFMPVSEHFLPIQFITHMFMHGDLLHILFNMFGLYMFGRILEQVWGEKRFFIFYFATGVGAMLISFVIKYFYFLNLKDQVSPGDLNMIIIEGRELMYKGMRYSDEALHNLNTLVNIPTVGASGAIFGIVAAFGVLFPETELMLLFPPIPIKAKYAAVLFLVLGYFMDRQGNVAHIAHFGGALIGFILAKYWEKNRFRRY